MYPQIIYLDLKKKVRCEPMEEVKKILKAEDGKLSTVLEYSSGARVEIPITSSGEIKWFDDNKLLKKNTSTAV